jgi:hypothetical protein
MTRWLFGLLMVLAGAARAGAATDDLDRIARDYTVLALQVRQIDPGLVLAPVPVPELLRRAQAHPIDRVHATQALDAIVTRIDRLPAPADPLLSMRGRSLRAHAISLAFQLRPADAPRRPAAEEVRLKFGFEPAFPPLARYDAAIAALDAALPGEGELAQRIEAMKARAQVPADRIEAVVRAALAECRRRTAAHLQLPVESIEARFVPNALVPAEAEFAGNGRSVVSISTVVPADVDRLLAMSCHEAYPGHHTHYATLEARLARQRGWPELTVDLADSPRFPVSDAISEYGIGLAFPLEDRIAFLRDVLYPLAGLKMHDEAAWRAYIQARGSVLGATSTIIRDYLDGAADAESTKRRLVRYRLQTRRAAEQMMKMLDAFGPFPIASDLGWFTIDRALRGKDTATQWRLLQRMEAEPMLLDDVAALGTTAAAADTPR